MLIYGVYATTAACCTTYDNSMGVNGLVCSSKSKQTVLDWSCCFLNALCEYKQMQMLVSEPFISHLCGKYWQVDMTEYAA